MIRVNDREIPWREKMTVSDLLQLVDDAHDCAVVRVNDRYVARHNFDAVVVPDGAEVFLIPVIAGG